MCEAIGGSTRYMPPCEMYQSQVVGLIPDSHALREIQDCFTRLNNNEFNKGDVRAVVFAGEGKHFR